MKHILEKNKTIITIVNDEILRLEELKKSII